MAALYPSSYPPDLTPEQEEYLTTSIKDWSIAHGLAVRPRPEALGQLQSPSAVVETEALATTAPVTLFPSIWPLNCFHEALMIQTAYNEMYSAVARDEEFLGQVAKELGGIDEFIGGLWEVHKKVKQEGYVQDVTLGLFRSDYMVHVHDAANNPKPTIRQVEFNTIASSFGGLSSRVTSLHRYLLQTAAFPREAAAVIRPDFLPTNASIESLADGLGKAHAQYGPPKTGRMQCILFIVQSPERNVFDQRHLEYAVFSYSRAKVFRLPFARVLADTQLGQDRTLIYTPPAFPDRQYEVTTVYFRAGYSPDEYTTPAAWDARYQIERSAAVKCPSVLTHLAGSKKVQQMLAAPGSPLVARFLPYPGIAARVAGTFAPIYPLDTSEAGLEARRIATNPETAARFVLKPQREGGGNNVYRRAIPAFLKSIPEERWPAYILMEMIEPPPQRNYILRNGEVQAGGVICELGVYGACLWRNGDGKGDKGEVFENVEAGYLLRTKGDQSEEGGVAAGFGAVDSCVLVDV